MQRNMRKEMVHLVNKQNQMWIICWFFVIIRLSWTKECKPTSNMGIKDNEHAMKILSKLENNQTKCLREGSCPRSMPYDLDFRHSCKVIPFTVAGLVGKWTYTHGYTFHSFTHTHTHTLSMDDLTIPLYISFFFYWFFFTFVLSATKKGKLGLSCTHTHTHTHLWLYPFKLCNALWGTANGGQGSESLGSSIGQSFSPTHLQQTTNSSFLQTDARPDILKYTYRHTHILD